MPYVSWDLTKSATPQARPAILAGHGTGAFFLNRKGKGHKRLPQNRTENPAHHQGTLLEKIFVICKVWAEHFDVKIC